MSAVESVQSFIGWSPFGPESSSYEKHRLTPSGAVEVETTAGETHRFEQWMFTPEHGDPYSGHHRYGIDSTGTLYVLHVSPHGTEHVRAYAPHAWRTVRGGARRPVLIEPETIHVGPPTDEQRAAAYRVPGTEGFPTVPDPIRRSDSLN
jgi:hypothetical protein